MSGEHTFLVTVSGCTAEQAAQVIGERLGPDEDYGFDYQIGSERVAPLAMVTSDHVERLLRRPLVKDEASAMKDALTDLLDKQVSLDDFLDGYDHDTPYVDMGASGLIEGHWFREYGMDDWILVQQVGHHGDRVLIWGETVDKEGVETSLDADTVVALLTTD